MMIEAKEEGSFLLSPPKTCSCCGVSHAFLKKGEFELSEPDDPEDPLAGVYWNCACGSTLFIKKEIQHEIRQY